METNIYHLHISHFENIFFLIVYHDIYVTFNRFVSCPTFSRFLCRAIYFLCFYNDLSMQTSQSFPMTYFHLCKHLNVYTRNQSPRRRDAADGKAKLTFFVLIDLGFNSHCNGSIITYILLLLIFLTKTSKIFHRTIQLYSKIKQDRSRHKGRIWLLEIILFGLKPTCQL